MTTTVLIDADGIAYRVASAVQSSVEWEPGVVSVSTDEREAKRLFILAIDRILAGCGGGEPLLTWSCPSRHYFRHDLLPSYKGNRKGAAPLALSSVREWATDAYPSKWRPNLEADDVLGILATNPRLVPGVRIIASPDKDLLQVPGLHYNPLEPAEGVFRVSDEYALRQLWLQTLVGDAVDGYSGCPNIGPKRAAPILEKCSSPGDFVIAVEAAFEKAGLTHEEFLVQHNVARILQNHTYDFQKQEPILYG